MKRSSHLFNQLILVITTVLVERAAFDHFLFKTIPAPYYTPSLIIVGAVSSVLVLYFYDRLFKRRRSKAHRELRTLNHVTMQKYDNKDKDK